MILRQLRSPNASAGFTLVEALVATALMGTILAALATISVQWLPNWNRGMARIQRNEHVALGIERLSADLAAAEYIPPHREKWQPIFEGMETSVTFVRTAIGPNAGPGAGLEVIRVAEVDSDRGPVLIRMRSTFEIGRAHV